MCRAIEILCIYWENAASIVGMSTVDLSWIAVVFERIVESFWENFQGVRFCSSYQITDWSELLGWGKELAERKLGIEPSWTWVLKLGLKESSGPYTRSVLGLSWRVHGRTINDKDLNFCNWIKMLIRGVSIGI